MIGQCGLNDAVLAEVDIALNAHKLIKVRIRATDKNKQTEQFAKIEHQLNAYVKLKVLLPCTDLQLILK